MKECDIETIVMSAGANRWAELRQCFGRNETIFTGNYMPDILVKKL